MKESDEIDKKIKKMIEKRQEENNALKKILEGLTNEPIEKSSSHTRKKHAGK